MKSKFRLLKKRLVLLIILWLVYFQTVAQQAKLTITPLSERLYVYTTYRDFNGTPFPSNSLYVVTNEGVLLIDTPWDTTQFQPLLDSIEIKHKKPVIFCVVTHYHDDRTAGLKYYQKKGIKTFSSEMSYLLGKEKKENTAVFQFKHDTTFVLGELLFHTYYPGKGHTADNILIWFEKDKILYAGCFVKSTESRGLGNITDADVKEWQRSVQKTMERYKDARIVIPGHFSWGDAHSLEHTLRLLNQ
jgi:metallo-beta-lactamase class B